MSKAGLVVDGDVLVYRIHDVGYAIDLARAGDLLSSRHPVRVRPERGEARTIRIDNPPLDVTLDPAELELDGKRWSVRLSARVFDFGVCSMRATIGVKAGTPWAEFAELGSATDSSTALAELLDAELTQLLRTLNPSIDRPGLAPVSENYVVFRVSRLAQQADGTLAQPGAVTDEHLVALLLGERQELSAAALRDHLSNRFSYYGDEMAILTWDNALIVDPRKGDHDVEYILEFANAQLLELRYYDEVLDRELPGIHDRVAAARRKRFRLSAHRFGPLVSELQTRVVDVSETVERVDNSLKVVDDVHLARVYAAALRLFREDAWRRGIDRKLAIIRETYAMLNDEAQAARSELLEIAIVVLIIVEIVLGLTVHR